MPSSRVPTIPPVPHLSQRETIIELTRTLSEARDADGLTGEPSGDRSDRLLLLSHIYHQGSYAELERCLCRLRDWHQGCYWHFTQRYAAIERRQTLGCPECGRATEVGVQHIHRVNRKSRKVARGPIIEERWHPGVDMTRVDRALDFLEADWKRHEVRPPQLPVELFQVLAA